jgi:hypothetical protein
MGLLEDSDPVIVQGKMLQALAEHGHMRITVERIKGAYIAVMIQKLSKPGYIQIRDDDTVTIPLPQIDGA